MLAQIVEVLRRERQVSYRTMAITFWLPQAQEALARVEGQ